MQKLSQQVDTDAEAGCHELGSQARPSGHASWRRGAGAAALALLLSAAALAIHRRSTAGEPGAAAASEQPGVSLAKAAAGGGQRKAKAARHALAKEQAARKKEVAAEKPCERPHTADEPGLFCWAVMWDSDAALVKSQLTGRAGIFACNDYAVISKEETLIGEDDCGEEFRTWGQDLPSVEKGTFGVNAETSSWLNVPVFMPCWNRVIESGKVWEQDFTVKLDPDAVFFPGRLGAFLAPHKGNPIFTTDCRFWEGDQVGNLFGAIEVLSKQAIGTYKDNAEKCQSLPWQGWGEDMWMQKCMDSCGVPAVAMFDQVSDGTCPLGGYAPCSSYKVVFHPQKDAGEWWDCWKQSADAPQPDVTE